MKKSVCIPLCFALSSQTGIITMTQYAKAIFVRCAKILLIMIVVLMMCECNRLDGVYESYRCYPKLYLTDVCNVETYFRGLWDDFKRILKSLWHALSAYICIVSLLSLPKHIIVMFG